MIRLGRIAYVNMAPVFHRLDADVIEVSGVPTQLSGQLLEAAIDVAPISSIAWAKDADQLLLLPRLCVSSDGAVDSIQLVSKLPLDQVRTVPVPQGHQADAKLLIGDAALRSAFEDPTPHHDLGRLWRERTGLPMVFAVWACRGRPRGGIEELEGALVRSVRLARAEPDRLAYEASGRYGYPPGFLARY